MLSEGVEGAGRKGSQAKAGEAHYLCRLVSLELDLGHSPCASPDFFSTLQPARATGGPLYPSCSL